MDHGVGVGIGRIDANRLRQPLAIAGTPSNSPKRKRATLRLQESRRRRRGIEKGHPMSSFSGTFPTRGGLPIRWTARPSVLLTPVAAKYEIAEPSHKQRSTLSSRRFKDNFLPAGE